MINISVIIPLVSFVFTFFLFLAVLGAKKNSQLVSFIILLGSFVLWTGGSLFMRLQVHPGFQFWCYVSITGVFMAPYCIYTFFFHYTHSKGYLLRLIWMGLWAVIIVLNFFDVFIVNTTVNVNNEVSTFNYGLSSLAIIPVFLAAATLADALRLIVRAVRRDGMPANVFVPFLIGVLIMFVGLVATAFMDIRGISSDTIFCLINAICIYYALYKRRLITLTPIASNIPVYFMAVVFATVIGVVIFPFIQRVGFSGILPDSTAQATLYTLTFSVLTILCYCIIHEILSKLFVESQEIRDKALADLSNKISQSLEISDTVAVFREFLTDNVDCSGFHICMPDDAGERFVLVQGSDELLTADFSISKGNPLVDWLQTNNQSIRYGDFCKTGNYKSMWASEKRALRELEVELVLPVNCNGDLSCIALLSAKNRGRPFTASEVSFLESAASIVAIAFKNASLYLKIQNEARRDALTGLYNRSFFLRHVGGEFDKARHDKFTMAIISLDDFRLFNELYGSHEGDKALRTLSEVITTVVGGKGMVARYSGKEIVLSLPFCSISNAEGIIEEIRTLFNDSLNPINSVYKKFLTFSAGVCGYPISAGSVDEIINYANLALYSAKKNGKNRTFVYSYNHATDQSYQEQEAQSKKQLVENSISTILALTAAIDAKDHYTFNHSDNVAKYASILARAIGLDSEHVEIVRQAGLLHDIGKIGIPESILSKQGPLTAEEYEIMKQHVEGSISMIRHLPSLDYVIPAAIGHHERWDGKGYPRGIKGENINIGARCLCLADSFDAMTTKRSYRNSMPVEQALAEIERNLGTQFDPILGRKFIDLVHSGEIKIITHQDG